MSILGAIGGIAGSLLNKSSADKQAKLQEKFARNAIQWKVEDAKAAGVHPLYALGANTTSYSPVSVGDMAGPLQSVGQDITRAVDATRTPEARVTDFTLASNKLQLDNMKLQNDLLASQIRRLNQPGSPPGVPASEDKAPQRTTHFVNPDGSITISTPGSDAQVAQDRYGELFEQIYGGRNWWIEKGRDAIRNYDHQQTMNDIINEVKQWNWFGRR